MRLRTVIADDEQLARELLKSLLVDDPTIEVIGESRNAFELVALLRNESVDLLFLDIEMPGGNGLEVVEQIGAARMPPTVFVTAHSQYAVRAFEIHALDYLTKPIELHRLKEALQHVKERIASKAALVTQAQFHAALASIGSANGPSERYAKRFLVPDGEYETVIPVSDIDWIEAADYYSSLHVGGKTYMLHQTTKQLADSLDPACFVRIHRSAIVNIDRVKRVLKEGRSEFWVVLTGGQRLRMSKNGWQTLLAVNQV